MLDGKQAEELATRYYRYKLSWGNELMYQRMTSRSALIVKINQIEFWTGHFLGCSPVAHR